QTGVAHLQRRVVKRFRVALPGDSSRRVRESDPGRRHPTRVFLERRASDEVQPLERVARLVVEPARTGIGPVQNLIYPPELLGIWANRPNLGDLPPQPDAVIQRDIDGI